MSRGHVDAQCHLEPILGPKMVAKWVPKCSKIGPETASKGDSISKLKKEGAKSVDGAAGELRPSTNWRVLGPLGEGNREGADCHHTPDDLVQRQGVGGKPYIRIAIAFSATSQALDIVSLFLENPRAYITFCGYLLQVSKLQKEGARSATAAAEETD